MDIIGLHPTFLDEESRMNSLEIRWLAVGNIDLEERIQFPGRKTRYVRRQNRLTFFEQVRQEDLSVDAVRRGLGEYPLQRGRACH